MILDRPPLTCIRFEQWHAPSNPKDLWAIAVPHPVQIYNIGLVRHDAALDETMVVHDAASNARR